MYYLKKVKKKKKTSCRLKDCGGGWVFKLNKTSPGCGRAPAMLCCTLSICAVALHIKHTIKRPLFPLHMKRPQIGRQFSDCQCLLYLNEAFQHKS